MQLLILCQYLEISNMRVTTRELSSIWKIKIIFPKNWADIWNKLHLHTIRKPSTNHILWTLNRKKSRTFHFHREVDILGSQNQSWNILFTFSSEKMRKIRYLQHFNHATLQQTENTENTFCSVDLVFQDFFSIFSWLCDLVMSTNLWEWLSSEIRPFPQFRPP